MNHVQNLFLPKFSLLLAACLFCNISLAKTIKYYPTELEDQLAAALTAKGENYQPRTEHLLRDGRPEYVNRLILEDSPYLTQHAHNPVHWFAWGEDAFAKAKRENKRELNYFLGDFHVYQRSTGLKNKDLQITATVW